MSSIQTRTIQGASVYGVEQVSYTVDGVSGQDYSAVIAAAGLRQAAAVEADMTAMAAVVRTRQRKLSDLNTVLAVLTKALATMPAEDAKTTDKSDADNALRDAAETARTYGIAIRLAGDNGNQIQRDSGMLAQSNVKNAMDLESNSLQQDSVTLQNLVSKRDSTYQTVNSIVKRALNASATAVRGLGA